MSKGFLYALIGILVIGGGVFFFNNQKEKTEAQHELMMAQAKLEAAKEVIQKKPEMPIELTKRDAVLGEGGVVQFKNIFSRNLTVIVKCNRPGLGDQKTFQVDLVPNQPKEIGHMEGWAFKEGDFVTLSHDNFEDLTRTIGK